MIFDFIFFLVISVFVVLGYKKGFSSMFISLIGLGLSIILALSLYSWFGNLFLKSKTGTEMKETLADEIVANMGNHNKAIENVPYLSSIAGVASDDEGIIDFDMLAVSIAKKITKFVIIIPLILLTVIATHIFMFVFKRFFSRITHLPIVHGVDCALGSVCGLLSALLIIATFFVFTIFLQFLPSLNFLQDQFNNSNIVLLINDFIL